LRDLSFEFPCAKTLTQGKAVGDDRWATALSYRNAAQNILASWLGVP
jgi:hypothetical protein